jgi:hypothetical protein
MMRFGGVRWHRWERPCLLGPSLYDCVIYYGIGLGFLTIGWDRDARDSDFKVRP